jgi:predicted nuclease of restriction endonuclease-like (RecB) superfamily
LPPFIILNIKPGNWNVISTPYLLWSLAERPAPEEVGPTEKSLLKDPYIIEFLGMNPGESLTERDLETALLNHLQQFVLELGKGFAFVARRYRHL